MLVEIIYEYRSLVNACQGETEEYDAEKIIITEAMVFVVEP